jgi:hypothetical protein
MGFGGDFCSKFGDDGMEFGHFQKYSIWNKTKPAPPPASGHCSLGPEEVVR